VHVGTTYKRALPQKIIGRDYAVSNRPGDVTALCPGSTIIAPSTLLENVMRKPRDFDGELKALQKKTRDLKRRKVQQLGDADGRRKLRAVGPGDSV
jgi:hypothetical protein